jgi:hypothetical protein
MRRSQRLIAATVLVALTGVLGGCSSGGFDPSDLLDWLDTKKKLPGDRKPVFPDGVPGLEQGVPKELYKSEVEKQQHEDAAAATAAQPAADQPPQPEQPAAKSKETKARKSRQSAAASAAPAAVGATEEPNGEAQAADGAGPATPSPAKHKKLAHHKRITAPPADTAAAQPPQPAQVQPAQPAQSAQESPPPFPAPLPSGSFTR